MSGETMREAVARDMYQAHLNLYRKIAAPWDMLDKFERERWLRYADAAIRTVLERLREPSDALLRVGVLEIDAVSDDPDGYPPTREQMRAGWQAMLDAAAREVG